MNHSSLAGHNKAATLCAKSFRDPCLASCGRAVCGSSRLSRFSLSFDLRWPPCQRARYGRTRTRQAPPPWGCQFFCCDPAGDGTQHPLSWGRHAHCHILTQLVVSVWEQHLSLHHSASSGEQPVGWLLGQVSVIFTKSRRTTFTRIYVCLLSEMVDLFLSLITFKHIPSSVIILRPVRRHVWWCVSAKCFHDTYLSICYLSLPSDHYYY